MSGVEIAEDAAYFRATVLRYVGRIVPKRTHELVQHVANDYGTTPRRRVQRALAKLRAAGLVSRRGDGYVWGPRM